MSFKSFRWHSLKTRVTLFTLGIFLLSLWLLAAYASWTLRNDMQNLLSDQQFSMVSFIAEEVNQEIDDRFSVLEKVAGRVRPAMLNHPATLQNFLEERLILQGPFNTGVFVIGIDGVGIADIPVGAGRIGVNYRDRDYIAGALQEGKRTIGRPVIGRVLRVPIFGMAVPIRDPQGVVIGALAGITNLSQPNFLDRITNSRYGQSGGYLLVAPQHRLVVTASDKSRIMETLPAPDINPDIDLFLAGYEGSAMIPNPRGMDVLVSDKGIPAAGWIAVVNLPTAEAFAPIRALQQRMAMATLFLSLLAGGLTWWTLKRQLSPMLAAVKTLSAWSEADQPPQPLPGTTQGEIGKLIRSFNHLLATLAQREKVLKKSEERFRSVMENITNIAVQGYAPDGTVIFWNRASELLYGYSAAEAGGGNLLDLIIPSAMRKGVAEAIQQMIETGETIPASELRLKKKDGSLVLVFSNHALIKPVGFQPELFCLDIDLTALKQAEQYEQFRSHILELLAGKHPLPEILEAIVLGVEQLHPAMRCSILLLDREGKHLGQGVAPSLPEFYNAALDGTEVSVGAGSCGTAAATRERVIVADIATHPYWVSYRELAVRAELGACWSQPICCSATGQALGVFAIYHREARLPTEQDLALLKQTAHLTSIAITHQQTEEALHATHQQLESLTAAVPGVVYQFLVKPTGEWQFLYVSPGIQHIYGITPEEALKNHLAITDCILPERRASHRRTVENATKNLWFWEHEHPILTAKGQLKWVRGQARPELQADGSVLWNGVLVDITERKQMEIKLQESNDLFSLFMHYSPILIYIKEVFPTESRVLRASDNYQDVIGIPSSEMVGKTMDELLPAEFAAKITAEDWAVVYGGQSMTLNEDYNGRHYITTKFPIYHAGKNLLAGYTTDITERRQLENALYESEERLSLVLRGTEDGFWDWNLERNTLYYSPRWWTMLGYADSELADSPDLWRDLMHPDDLDRVNRVFSTALADHVNAYKVEFRLLHQDGHYVSILSRGFIQRDEQGKALRVTGANMDITERQQMEEQVRQLAFYDTLTQLPNRRLFNDRLSQTMAASKRSGGHGALMFIDLDNFKPLNDTQGHKVGDLLLIEVAERLKGCVREMDTVARFGGDEFVVILSELNVDKAKSILQAEIVAEKIRLMLSNPYWLTIEHDEKAATTIEYRCTASIGVAVFVNHEDHQDDVLKWADMAMYEAKKAGRNLIRFYGVAS